MTKAPSLTAQAEVIVVADDEPSMLSLISQHVQSLGHTVYQARDGEEALRQIREKQPALVLLDVMMPNMSGWEVCKKIRSTPDLANIGVIMITGIGETLNELTSPLYGADKYLDKPFELADLDEAISTVLSERKQKGKQPNPNKSKTPSSPKMKSLKKK